MHEALHAVIWFLFLDYTFARRAVKRASMLPRPLARTAPTLTMGGSPQPEAGVSGLPDVAEYRRLVVS